MVVHDVTVKLVCSKKTKSRISIFSRSSRCNGSSISSRFILFCAFKGDATLANDQLPLVSKVVNQDMKIETYFFYWHTLEDKH